MIEEEEGEREGVESELVEDIRINCLKQIMNTTLNLIIFM